MGGQIMKKTLQNIIKDLTNITIEKEQIKAYLEKESLKN